MALFWIPKTLLPIHVSCRGFSENPRFLFLNSLSFSSSVKFIQAETIILSRKPDYGACSLNKPRTKPIRIYTESQPVVSSEY
jgi:hypothetical protein